MVGRVLDALEASGLAGHTIVVYTSDHGEQMGEHGLWWKSTFYEGSVGVPMIIVRPGFGQGGCVLRSNVSRLDRGPTLLDLVEADPIPWAAGRSFRCLIEGRPEEWSEEVLAENYGGAGETTAQRMIRRGPWKLNYYQGMRPQLFHLEDDPNEWNDRWGDPACGDIVADLQSRLLEGWDPAAMEQRFILRYQELRLIGEWVKRTQPPEPDPCWFDRPLDNYIEDLS